MTPGSGSLELAIARIGARRGIRPGEATWQRLEALREFRHLLDAVRETSLAPWTKGITAPSDAHAVERALRAGWRAEAGEVAAWMPAPWQEALAWWATWIDLPVVEHLARGEPALAWMVEDTMYRAVLEGTAVRDRSPAPVPVLRELAAGMPAALLDRWCARWQALLPGNASNHAPLREAQRVLAAHLAALRAPALETATALRRGLVARLLSLYRRATLDPAVAFLHLALDGVDFERLRGDLVQRVVSPALVAESPT